MKRGFRQTLKAILFLALAVLFLWLSFRGVNFSELWVIIRDANYIWLLPAIIMSLLSFVIRARRWILLIEPLGYSPSLVNTTHTVTAGYLANIIFPRLGEVFKCAALSRKEDIPFDRLVGTMLIERTIDILTVLLILGITLIAGGTSTGSFLSENVFQPAEQKLSSSFGSASFFTVIVVLLAVTAIIMFFLLRQKLAVNPFFKKIYTFSSGLLSGLKSIARLRRRGEFLLLTLLLWVCYFFMSYFPLLCLESTSHLGLGATFFILIIGSFGMAAPVQSGLGAYHWIISRGMLVAYAIPLEEGLAYATLEHESQLILIAIVGAISLFILFGTGGGKMLSKVATETGN